jgi:hypothetical protein
MCSSNLITSSAEFTFTLDELILTIFVLSLKSPILGRGNRAWSRVRRFRYWISRDFGELLRSYFDVGGGPSADCAGADKGAGCRKTAGWYSKYRTVTSLPILICLFPRLI